MMKCMKVVGLCVAMSVVTGCALYDSWAYAEMPYVEGMPQINGPRVYGVQPGRELIYRIPTSGERPMSWSVRGLPRGVTVEDGILRGVIAEAGDYEIVVTAKNAKGHARRALVLRCGDKLALTPPMGWSSWYSYSEGVSQADIEKTARLLVESGLADYGYQFVNIDDTWQGVRGGPDMAIQPNVKFPDMKGLCDTVHALGLKAGIYSTPWMGTYAGFIGGSAPNEKLDYSEKYIPREKRGQETQFFGTYPGTLNVGYNKVGPVWMFDKDVKQWCEWGFDFAKIDWLPNDVPTTKRIAEALAGGSRSIVLSLSNAAPFQNIDGLSQYANLTRTTHDIQNNWGSVKGIGFSQERWQKSVKPGHWPDPDMLQIGHVGVPGRKNVTFKPTRLTKDEQRTQMTLWCMLQAPLIISCDLEQLDTFTKSLLCDPVLLAINQDEAAHPAKIVKNEKNLQTWEKLLADGRTAVAEFNLADVEQAGIAPHACRLTFRVPTVTGGTIRMAE